MFMEKKEGKLSHLYKLMIDNKLANKINKSANAKLRLESCISITRKGVPKLRIAVCIKQVPDTTEVAIDEEKGILKREGVDSRMNPYDLYGLETALRLKEKFGGEVIVISMGPPQAAAVIKEAYAMGADTGFLLSDRKFAGADTLATAYTLAKGLQKLGPLDLIITGMQTTDGDTAQVGPGIAEYLGWPHISYVTKIVDSSDSSLTVTTDMLDTIETQKIVLPALLTVAKDINRPRLLSYKLKCATQNKEIKVLSYKDLAGEGEDFFGLDGSPTQVERIFPPERNCQQELWQGEPQELANRLVAKLKELRFI